MTLLPCTSCARHVRSTEPACPFCGAVVAPAVGARGPVSRALGIAIGVATMTNAAALGACLHAAYGAPPPPDAGSRDAAALDTGDTGP